ncbi:MAG: hypothetical protein RTU92_15040 [Candidatus Thorarchaeota archaeon]
MPQSETAKGSNRATKGFLILLSAACTIVVFVYKIYGDLMAVPELQAWRLTIITVAVGTLALITVRRKDLVGEFNVRYLQLWMIYGMLSALLIMLAQVHVHEDSGLYRFLDASIYPFGLTFFMLLLIKSQYSIERTYIPYVEPTRTLSELVKTVEDKSGIGFISITKILLDPSYDFSKGCPECGLELNFREKYDWYGPTAFTCPYCERIVHMEELGL